MKNLNLFIIERLKINKDTKAKIEITFDEFISLMKTSKNNKFTYVDSIKNLKKFKMNHWYKWDVLENTYVYISRKRYEYYRTIAIQKSEYDNNYIDINVVDVSIEKNGKYEFRYYDWFFESSSVTFIIKNTEWVDEFLNLLSSLANNPNISDIRSSSEFIDFKNNFLTDEYLKFNEKMDS